MEDILDFFYTYNHMTCIIKQVYFFISNLYTPYFSFLSYWTGKESHKILCRNEESENSQLNHYFIGTFK